MFSHTVDITQEMIPRITAENPPNQTSPIHVNARWLSDLELFNEWPNEEDYLMLPISQAEITGRNLVNIPGLSQFNNMFYRIATPMHRGYPRKVRIYMYSGTCLIRHLLGLEMLNAICVQRLCLIEIIPDYTGVRIASRFYCITIVKHYLTSCY